MNMVSLKCFLVLALLASVALGGATLPTRILVIADAIEHMTNLVSSVASKFTAIATVTGLSDNASDGPTCYLCNPIPTTYAIVIWETEVASEFENSANWPVIKQNIEDFVNTGRILLLTGESALSGVSELLGVIGANSYKTVADTTGVSGSFTNYPTCDPLLRGFFGDIRDTSPSAYAGNVEDQTLVDITIAGAGQSICWEATHPEIGAGGRFTSAQKGSGGFVLYMQCEGDSDYSQFTEGFYRINYNNAIDYAFILQDGGFNVPPTQYRDFLVVSTMPADQLSSPINALYHDYYVPLIDIYAEEVVDASILGSAIDPNYDVVIIVLYQSDYSSSTNFASYLANLQAFADDGGLVIIYGASPEIELDPGWIPFVGGSAAAADNSGLSSQFGNFANCASILNGPFGSYVSLNPNNLDLSLAADFQNLVDSLTVSAATSCLNTNAGDAVISYLDATDGGLIVYLTSHSINDIEMENFQDVTRSWYRDVYNNLIANFLGLIGGAGGDPHIFTFGGGEIELAFQSGKRYVFYGSHDFSIVVGTVGYLNTIFIAEVGITMGTFHLEATQLDGHPAFLLNGEEITESVHTPLGEASIFVPQDVSLRGALAEMEPYLELGLRIGDTIEIVGGYYAPFIFYNIEVVRSSPSAEFGLLHAARHQSKRDVNFLDQFETSKLF